MGMPVTPDELAESFDRHAGALRLYVRQWCDVATADDIVQEAFVALASQRRLPDNIAAWLYRVSRNRAVSWGRKRRSRERHERSSAAVESLFVVVDDGITPHEAERLVNGLAAENREAVVARVWGGLSFEEMARLMSCSVSTAHRRYREGLLELHRRLEGPCPQNTTTTRQS